MCVFGLPYVLPYVGIAPLAYCRLGLPTTVCSSSSAVRPSLRTLLRHPPPSLDYKSMYREGAPPSVGDPAEWGIATAIGRPTNPW